jgi:FkbM family methyltransferase
MIIEGHPVKLFETATGRWWLPTDMPSDFLVNEIIAGRVFEGDVVEEALRHIKPGTTVLDLGANFGQMSVLFARKAAWVYAFEADPFIATVLRLNCRENQVHNISIFQKAVWDRDYEDLVYQIPNGRFEGYGSYGIQPGATSGQHVRSMIVDWCEPKHPISFMKVDVQGSDLRAMRGARRTIERWRMPVIFEFEELFCEEFGTCLDDYMGFVHEIGYEVTKVINGVNYLIEPKR